MAGGSLLALLDDIASLLDDVAVLSKAAAKRTAGVLGDDLALNAEQVTGVQVDRELPVVWAVAKGSAVNKAILVPSALAVSLVAPWAILPLLMLGGAFLCFEGFEKIVPKVSHGTDAGDSEEQARAARTRALTDDSVDPVLLEREKVKGAIRTDFILSAEIIVIALGVVSEQVGATFATRVGVLVAIAALMTVGVYGFVALIVKLDDMGLALVRRDGALKSIGRLLLFGAPWLMKGLSVAGTAAMFLVGGGILAHGIPGLEARVKALAAGLGGVVAALAPTLTNALVGVLAGGVVFGGVTLVKRLRGSSH
ncbi:MAG: DUF808 domain-containing protein [Deltaproteobacteria bacterium]|nr:DUF808 domain-containing protein [Deltaproteobacteria bacterium]